MNSESELLDLIRYDSVHHPFVDMQAHLSLSFAGPATIGPQWLHPRSILSTYQLVQPVLKLWLIDANDQWHAARRTVLRSWPWMAEEDGTLPGLSVSTRYVFQDERSIVVEMVVRNTGQSPVPTRLAWTGAGVPDIKLYMLDYFEGASREGRSLTVTRSDAGESVQVSLRPNTNCDLPEVTATIRCMEGGLQAHLSSTAVWSSGARNTKGPFFVFVNDDFALNQGESARFVFSITIEVGGSTKDERAPMSNDFDAMIRQRRSALTALIETASGSAVGWLIQRARLGLLRCGLQGLDGEFGADIASLCTADASDFSCSFFWDSLFSSIALSRIDAELARGAIRTVFTRQLERDGSSPERKFNHSVPQRMAQQSPQSPIGTWALNRYLMDHSDIAFASEIYPKLKSNFQFWRHYSDVDRDGLAEYRWSGQVSDNSPLWDFYGLTDGKPAGCQWLPPVASVALNSFLYRDALELTTLSARLGVAADTTLWNQEALAIAGALNQHCYVPEERRFWDFNHHTNQHRRVRTFWMFWPLWAGIPMAPAMKKDLIENVLLDPRQFFGAIPFPSVAYDEPSYSPKGYWRGKAWPHVSTWLVELLEREGYVHEARIAASRLLAAWAELGGPTENLSTDATQPSGGFADYNWGCAAVILLQEFLAGRTLCTGRTTP